MLQQTQTATLDELTERLQRENLRARWISRAIVVSALVSLVLLGRYLSTLFLLMLPFVLLGYQYEGYSSKRRRKVLEEAIVPLGSFQERGGLGALLRFRRTLIFTTTEENKLQVLCINPLYKLVPKATADELERLGKGERKELVSLLYITLGPHFIHTRLMGGSKEPNAKSNEFGIALFLALTTLKEPGGEKSARLVLKRYDDERLREAAQEYLSRESTSSALRR